MSSLQRYKKTGGFLQLLSLVETFGPQKREKFLEIIENESPVWANAIREKMLTFERIFSWPEQFIVEIFKQLQPKTLAFAFLGLKEEQKAKILSYFSHAEKRRIEDLLAESKPKPDEVAATLVKVVEQTRKMLKDKELLSEKFDDQLYIPEDFEVKLEELATQAQFQKLNTVAAPAPAPATSAPEPSIAQEVSQETAAAGAADVLNLQRKVAQLLKENKQLKDETVALRSKLDQIRKIA